MPAEVKIKIKDESISMVEKFLIYEPFTISQNDPILKNLVEKSVAKWKGSIQYDIYITIKVIRPEGIKIALTD